jgi:hypothetical protein
MASLRRVLVGNAATKGKDLSVSSELEEPDREFVNIVCIYIIYIYIHGDIVVFIFRSIFIYLYIYAYLLTHGWKTEGLTSDHGAVIGIETKKWG